MASLPGQANASWRIRPDMVLRGLLSHGFILAVVPGVPGAVALGTEHTSLSIALVMATGLCTIAGFAGRRWGAPDDIRRNEAITIFLFLFVIASALPIPAFVLLGLSPVDAVFESVSGVTSTGLSVAGDIYDWPLAGHILRAWLQWTGGFAIAVAGAAILVGSSASKSMGEVGIDDPDILRSSRDQARALLWVYAAITVVAILVLLVLIPTPWEAVAVALAAVSTGGFTPRSDSLASYSTLAQAVTLMICMATTISLSAYVFVWRRDLRAAVRHGRLVTVAILLVLGAALVTLALAIEGPVSASHLGDTLLNFVSGMTTAGFSVAPVAMAPLALIAFCAAMAIGGATGSTAGGIKIDRIASLLQMVRLSLLRLRVPDRALTSLSVQGERVTDARVLAIVAIAVCYVITVLLLWTVLLGLGNPPLAALFDSISAVSTVGLSTGLISSDLETTGKIAVTIAMLLGRVEFLAVLLVILPSSWARKG